MGVMRFVVDDIERVTEGFLADLYIASLEGIPWRCYSEKVDDGFQIRRRIDESGSLYAMWELPNGKQALLCTANLRVRERPYLLGVELARGTLNRLRNQTAGWRQAGLNIPSELTQQIAAAAEPFCIAATSQHDLEKATAAANESIEESLRGCDMLIQTYLRQMEEERRRRAKPALMFGMDLPKAIRDDEAATALKSTFNMTCIEPCWADCEPVDGDYDWLALDETVDWARKNRMRTMMGPILTFDDVCLPDWLVLWEEDFPTLQSYVVNYVREVVERFRGEVNLWHCAAKLNSGRVLSLTDEQRLKLTVASLAVLRQVTTKTPVIVGFDQPWAEYMAQANTDVAPVHYADALARANLGLGGLALHIDWGYRPGGTMPRHPLELSQLIDQWSLLGLPLVIFLTMPSNLDADGDKPAKVTAMPGGPFPPWDAAAHSRLASKLVEICWCKQSVQGVFWSQTFDNDPHGLPHAGLFDVEGSAKPLFKSLREVRERCLA
mgnify:FL=1